MSKWFLISSDGIIDVAYTKKLLMMRNGFSSSRKEGDCYYVSFDSGDGIGSGAWIVHSSKISVCGFDEILDDYKKRSRK